MAAEGTLSVLYVGTLPPYPGGSALSSAQILAGLGERGHRVRALAPLTVTAAGDAFAAAHPRLAVERFAVPHFDFDHTDPAGDAYRRDERREVRRRVRALLAAERPDVLMTGRESFALHVADLAQAFAIPFVLRAAGGLSTELLAGTLPPALAEALREAYRRADLLVTPAAHLAHRLRTELGLQRVTVVPNAVDLELFAPRARPETLKQRLGIGDDAIVVLHASNLVASKRPLDIIASAPTVLRVEPRVMYIIVGDGPLRGDLEAACRRHGVEGRCRFTGWVEYDEMPAYMNLADIVTLPAQAETQARVYLEGQASGRLVLASNIPAAREVITDGETGLLHARGDVADLTRQTVRAAADPLLRYSIGHRAREHVRSHDLEIAVDAYVTAFAELRTRHQSRVRGL